MEGLAYAEIARRNKAVRYVNLAWDEAAHPRGEKGTPEGGQFVKAGKARDAKGAEAQKNKRAEKDSEETQKGNADPEKMDDKQLQELSAYLYSFKSSDPQIVAARIKVANALKKRGQDVNDHGGLGKSKGKSAPSAAALQSANKAAKMTRAEKVKASGAAMAGKKAPAKKSPNTPVKSKQSQRAV